MSTSREKAQHFLDTGSQFRLGALPTEMQHPRSLRLSEIAQSDLQTAVRLFAEIEAEAYWNLHEKSDEVQDLARAIQKTLDLGHRVFIGGCGATGRLALALESMWRDIAPSVWVDRVIAFTAGGDYALVRSLGIFEDRQELGARHLMDLGFSEGDMMIGVTEGGETSFVLGATEKASQSSYEPTWLLFCNPKDVLIRTTERSKRAIENRHIRSVAIETGPMILAGSTRLQASSVLMGFVGAAMSEVISGERADWFFAKISKAISETAADASTVRKLCELIKLEESVHRQNGYTLHRSRSLAIGVLTDTTERAPTFSLTPFENSLETVKALSRTYLEVPGSHTALESWTHILKRKPRAFHPPPDVECPPIDESTLLGFDFSESVVAKRTARGAKTTLVLSLEYEQGTLRLEASGVEVSGTEFSASQVSSVNAAKAPVLCSVSIPTGEDPLVVQCVLKFVLNVQSTLMMGRLGRFHGNLMTFVRPANRKLIDRSLRTIRALAEDLLDPHQMDRTRVPSEKLRERTTATDERLQWIAETASDLELLEALYDSIDGIGPDEPAVWRTLDRLLG